MTQLYFYNKDTGSVIDTALALNTNTYVGWYSKHLYGNPQTLADYKQEYATDNIVLIDSDELDQELMSANMNKYGYIKEITESQYIDMLECLPPFDYTLGADLTYFKMRENLCGDLTEIYVKYKNKFFAFAGDFRMNLKEITQTVERFITGKPHYMTFWG